MSERACQFCGADLGKRRKQARFCDSTCRSAAFRERNPTDLAQPRGPGEKPFKTVAAASRRPSRDGSGVHVYLLPDEIAALREVIGPMAARVLGVTQLPSKLDRASERVGRKERN